MRQRDPKRYKTGYVSDSGCTVLEEIAQHVSPSGAKRRAAKWRCHCGVEFEASFGNILGGAQKSCGCLKLKAMLDRCLKHGHSHVNRATRVYRF